MAAPPWFDDWVDEAGQQLDEKNDLLIAEIGMGDRPDYQYDLRAGTVTYGEGGVPKVVVEVQVIGTTSIKSGDWLWGWGNSSFPAHIISDVSRVRGFGETHGIEELTNPCIVPDNDLHQMAIAFTAIAVRVVEAMGAIGIPQEDGSGSLYLFVRSINRVPSEQRPETGGRLSRLMKRLKG